MSESTTEVQADVEQPQEGTQDKPAETFDAEYVAKLRKEAAEYRTKAKANADAAKRLAEIEDAQKTADQRAAEREAAAEKRIAEAEARAARRDIAIEHRLTPDDAALLDDLTDEEAMQRLAARLAASGAPRAPRPDLNQGRAGDAVLSPEDAFVAFANTR